jgi:hypothetical protein
MAEKKFRAEDTQTLGESLQNLVAIVKWHLSFVDPCCKRLLLWE